MLNVARYPTVSLRGPVNKLYDEARRAELIQFDSPYLVLIRIDIKSGVSFHNSCRHVMSEK